jgi:Ras association domain-containing protein 2/4
VASSDTESGKECDGVTCSNETCGSETSSAAAAENKLKSLTLPHKLDIKQIDWDELDDLLQVRQVLLFITLYIMMILHNILFQKFMYSA